MGEYPNGADEARPPSMKPLSVRVREAANSVAVFLDMVEAGQFPANDASHRDMFRASVAFLEHCAEAARRSYTAQMRGYHRRRARAMEVEDRLADIEASANKWDLPL